MMELIVLFSSTLATAQVCIPDHVETKNVSTEQWVASANPCVFREDKGKYVECTSFASGKCKTGTKACKPASKCVYRPEEGKYVSCSTFAAGKCKSGKRACTPESKCVYRPDKGKYVTCSTFAAGKCKSGVKACTP